MIDWGFQLILFVYFIILSFSLVVASFHLLSVSPISHDSSPPGRVKANCLLWDKWSHPPQLYKLLLMQHQSRTALTGLVWIQQIEGGCPAFTENRRILLCWTPFIFAGYGPVIWSEMLMLQQSDILYNYVLPTFCPHQHIIQNSLHN